ncbi:heterokaryon incompatibility protein-domain-containing protein, partial [Epithele typhae]|uniref:heterokaryon incompatibility protein-domain-containing protein n=1 Tax=Epithele typhae TaxID=378194 RepID=UPI0020088FFD
MRMLDTSTGRFSDQLHHRRVRYAILSHVWSRREHSNYAEYPAPDSSILPHLSDKVQKACELARSHNFKYLWIDTCCIDKTSSSELSKAINSMFEWYRCAKVCYAFLVDVHDGVLDDRYSGFVESEWWNRGWTLQELIAPPHVLFLTNSWTPFGTKQTLSWLITSAFGIDEKVLRNERVLSDVCVAERMSWAANRKTTEDEDEAYCLIGIFGVNVTPIYGEGQHAFVRLQHAILAQIPDQTLFAWGGREKVKLPLHGDPKFFHAAGEASISQHQLSQKLAMGHVTYPHYTATSFGMRTSFPMLSYTTDHGVEISLAFLACEHISGASENLLALILRHSPTSKEKYVGVI